MEASDKDNNVYHLIIRIKEDNTSKTFNTKPRMYKKYIFSFQ